MKKRSLIILIAVVAVLAAGLISSHFFDWPVDTSETSGDIGKADRFSREMESEKLTNMEELLKNDTDFKDGIVVAQTVMQTRALQFASLVDMSNEVAGNIPAFAEVLKDMNEASKMVANVNNSLAEAAENLNAALSGEECPDLAQNTINAALAYTTLQKQNSLANRFIETTDKYLETAQGDDHLKLVRDQWLEYQRMTAALEGDKKSAEALANKGNLLAGDKALAAIADFDAVKQVVTMRSSEMAKSMGITNEMARAIPEEVFQSTWEVVQNAVDIVSKTANRAELKSNTDGIDRLFESSLDQAMKNAPNDVSSSITKLGLFKYAQMKNVNIVEPAAGGMANRAELKNVDGVSGGISGAVNSRALVRMVDGANRVVSSYEAVMRNTDAAMKSTADMADRLCSSVNEVIQSTAAGDKTMGLLITY
jgi:hypothetical protein